MEYEAYKELVLKILEEEPHLSLSGYRGEKRDITEEPYLLGRKSHHHTLQAITFLKSIITPQGKFRNGQELAHMYSVIKWANRTYDQEEGIHFFHVYCAVSYLNIGFDIKYRKEGDLPVVYPSNEHSIL